MSMRRVAPAGPWNDDFRWIDTFPTCHEPDRRLRPLRTRRQFFSRGKNALGWAALTSLLGDTLAGKAAAAQLHGKPILPHWAAKAKSVIYLHMVGGPSQMDMFDYKPEMEKWYDKDLPESIRNGQDSPP